MKSVGKNIQLMNIVNNMPEYEACRKEFFEHFHMFQKLGVVNYAALGQYTGFHGPASEVVGIFLAGMALGRASEISEREADGLQMDVWSALVAWTLVEGELRAILPELPRLPAPAEITISV